jgi:hypothetical protein
MSAPPWTRQKIESSFDFDGLSIRISNSGIICAAQAREFQPGAAPWTTQTRPVTEARRTTSHMSPGDPGTISMEPGNHMWFQLPELEILCTTVFFSCRVQGGGAHLTARVSGQANNCWHGMGTCAPDMRCGAKPCPVTATVEYFGQLQLSLLFSLFLPSSALPQPRFAPQVLSSSTGTLKFLHGINPLPIA